MRDIAQHLLDILENSAKAGASQVTVRFETAGSWLTIDISDNGPGFPAGVLAAPGDPWQTTRTTRAVGLGLSLLRAAAEQTGGQLRCANRDSGGAHLAARFNFAHIDAKPIGDLAETFLLALLAWPSLDYNVSLGVNSAVVMVFDSVAVKAELDGIAPGHPDIRRVLESILKGAFSSLHTWSAQALFAGGG